MKDCNWYRQSDNCALFGNDSSKERFGYIANTACCACGRVGNELPSDEYYCEDFPSGWHGKLTLFSITFREKYLDECYSNAADFFLFVACRY